ncbi:MAG: imidazolonepropionase [Alphaproteobacteria bacterium]
MWDALWVNLRIATMAGSTPFGLIEDGAVAATDGRIAWVGPRAALPASAASLARRVHDGAGRLMTPGLVDPHTHVVYAGDGVTDFELLTQGGTRAQMIAAGGGVPGLVRNTRGADEERLYALTEGRVKQLIAHGVTTMESKSGAGLDLDTEMRSMRVSRELGRRLPVTVVSTFLGAHSIGPEFDGRWDDYVDFLCGTVLPAAIREDLVDAVDGFCDPAGFNHDQISRLFEVAAANGLPVKLHAEQYRDYRAADLVAKFRGLSADHLEYASEQTIRVLADAGTVATLLPGAHFVMGETKRPLVPLMRELGVPIALATNCNPVSSPTMSPPMMMTMACRFFGLTTEEALAAFTRIGARALGFTDRGTIEVGKVADFALWDVSKPGEIAATIAQNRCVGVVKGAVVAYEAVPIELRAGG